jgi:hypothetical protein
MQPGSRYPKNQKFKSKVLFYSPVLVEFRAMELTPERKEKLLDVLSKRQAGLTVVMENVDDPHNISAVMRTCEAVGIQDIFVLTTKIHPHRSLARGAAAAPPNGSRFIRLRIRKNAWRN